MSVLSETKHWGRGLSVEDFRRDLIRGLSRPDRSLPSKYFYDEHGARLFEEICKLKEYYPTRTEVSILRRHIREITWLLGARCNLVELGSGSSAKTRWLLDHLEHPAAYIPIDVASAQLLESCAELNRVYPQIEVLPVCADFTSSFLLPALPMGSGRTTVFFPGSTIGNFEPHEAELLLRRISRLCGEGTSFLVGVDLEKDPVVLHRAYNDALGITAEFNRNILARANRELGADFNLDRFRHHAFYNEQAGRIEMHLVSESRQTVQVGDEGFSFDPEAAIRTEYSYKYSLGEFHDLAQRAGLAVGGCWTDPMRWFSVHYLVPQHDSARPSQDAQIPKSAQSVLSSSLLPSRQDGERF